MKIRFPKREDQNAWAQQYERLQNARSFVLAFLAALVCLPIIWMAVPKRAPEPLPPQRYTSISLEHTPAELQAMFNKAKASVEAHYIRRDLARQHLHQIGHGWADRIVTEGDLAQALNNLTQGLGDPWSQALWNAQSADERLRDSGKTIGVDFAVGYDGTHKYWKVLKVEGTSEAAGLKVDDEILAIDGDDPAQYESNQSDDVKKLLTGFPPDNLIGSLVALRVRRNKQELDFEVPRVVTGGEDALKTKDGKDASIQLVDVNFFRSPTLVAELQKVITEKRAMELQGLVIDLSQVQGGTAEVAAQAAALFMKEGLVCRSVVNGDTPSSYWVDSWLVTTDGVKLVRSGPFTHEPNQAKKPVAAGPDVVLKEIKTPTNLFQGPVAIVTDWATRGAPELFANAVRSSNLDRVVIFASTTTWGKGLGQTTYDEVAGPFALRFSTSYHLTSSDKQLERRALRPNNDAVVPLGEDVGKAAAEWMAYKLETIPAPILPVDK